jgi:hypothetical protein
MNESTYTVKLEMPRGAIKEVTVDVCEVDTDVIGWDFRAWIVINSVNMEFIQGCKGDDTASSWFPFEGHDTYRWYGATYFDKTVNSFEDWVEAIVGYAKTVDLRDLFRYRQQEGL